MDLAEAMRSQMSAMKLEHREQSRTQARLEAEVKVQKAEVKKQVKRKSEEIKSKVQRTVLKVYDEIPEAATMENGRRVDKYVKSSFTALLNAL
mmetsp:Transcript_50016/g.100698  ORF Transcript_50016/g.100698 Transcript_50016/m.100698 type:complete len:93 (-) Transcript_50016:91-369(-)